MGRGRPLPLFRGSGSKTMLAHLPLARLRKIYERHAQDPDVLAIGTDWDTFWASMKKIRQKGFYVSIREVSELSMGIAAPIALPKVGVVAVISLVLASERLPTLNTEGLGERVSAVAKAIAARLANLTHTVDLPATATPPRF
jgi:DNA-binding IclR family transcriptional regulator